MYIPCNMNDLPPSSSAITVISTSHCSLGFTLFHSLLHPSTSFFISLVSWNFVYLLSYSHHKYIICNTLGINFPFTFLLVFPSHTLVSSIIHSALINELLLVTGCYGANLEITKQFSGRKDNDERFQQRTIQAYARGTYHIKIK